MSQIKTYQHFVFKLHTQRLKKAGWSLSLTLADARRNGELVPPDLPRLGVPA